MRKYPHVFKFFARYGGPGSQEVSGFNNLLTFPETAVNITSYFLSISKLFTPRSGDGKIPDWLCYVPDEQF